LLRVTTCVSNLITYPYTHIIKGKKERKKWKIYELDSYRWNTFGECLAKAINIGRGSHLLHHQNPTYQGLRELGMKERGTKLAIYCETCPGTFKHSQPVLITTQSGC
jgi:hypothetical protein